jgi:hypothetical protein
MYFVTMFPANVEARGDAARVGASERVPLLGAGIREILSYKLQQLSISTLLGAHHIMFAWRRLWSALQETGIELLFLTVSGTENAMDEMFTYLRSLDYRG